MGDPLISIITPVYNGEKYIEQAIKSVLSQTYRYYEYIIIDGRSSDRTVDIIRSYENKLAYWISEHDKGISDAFNKGVLKAKGDIIGILNCDDWYEIDALEKVSKIFMSKKPDLICGGVRFWYADKEINVSYPDVNSIKKETSIHHASVFISKNAYKTFGLYSMDYKYAMDYELILRFYVNGLSFYSLNSVIANRRLSGLSYRNKNKALFETLKARKMHLSEKTGYINFLFIWLKDTIGRLLKNRLTLTLYRYYWNKKNQKMSGNKVL